MSKLRRGGSGKVLALSGGVGGAKLARGLAEVLAPDQLTVVANTGDDFNYWGLRICPDLDSNLYALADRNDTQRGWGLADESWRVMASMHKLGADDWFQLGDRDLATHLYRSHRLQQGASLSEVMSELVASFGLKLQLLPMTEQVVETTVLCQTGQNEPLRELAFQEYFVRERCEPTVQSVAFRGVDAAQMQPDFLALLHAPDLAAIVICPSNPFLSIDPILALPGCVDALRNAGKPIIAVSPIVAGQAVKGPAAKMMRELSMPARATAVAQYYQQRYGDFLDGFIIDSSDVGLLDEFATLRCKVEAYPTMMTDLASKSRLAEFCLDFAAKL